MSLYKAELRRLSKRRVTTYMGLLGLLVLAAVAVGTFFSNQKIGPAHIAAAEREAEQVYQEQLEYTQYERRLCEEAQRAGTPSDGKDRFPPDCSSIEPPKREDFRPEWYLPETFEFRTDFPQAITGWALILAMVAFIVGASFVGAEWSSGGMTNLLLWRPQRIQVLLAKLGALVTGLVGASVLTGVAWFGTFWLIAMTRGSTEGVTAGVWRSLLLTGLRGVVIVLAAGVVGFALAALGRNTALALGGVIAALLVGQVGLSIALAIAQVEFAEKWLVSTYVLAWLNKKVTLENWTSCTQTVTGTCEPARLEIVWQQAGVLMAAVVLITLGAALWLMRRRDVA